MLTRIRQLPLIFRQPKFLIIAVSVLIIMTAVLIMLANRPTQSATPKFQTILPAGKTIDQLGGWQILHPPESDTVYEYHDTLDDVAISVVEQALPASFIEDVDKGVSDLAKKFNATNQIQAGSVRVYLGVSSQGPQSVIFAKNNLLILIRSAQAIPDQSWQKYITSLQ